MSWRTWFTSKNVKESIKRPWIRKAAYSLIGFFVLFSLILFFAGPPLLKSYLTDSLSRTLGRKVSVGAVHVNPLELSVAVDDFSLAERDGKTPFISFKQAYMNAQMASILFAGPVLSEIRLTQPYVNLVRTANNTYNFQDIVDRLSKTPSEPQQKPSKPMRFSLNNIRITQGRIEFDDRPKYRRHEIHDLSLAIPFLSNLFYRLDKYIEPEFSAVVNGAPFHLTGKSKPFDADREASLNLKLNRLGLSEYLTYVPKKLHFSLPGGTLDADIKVAFVQPEDKAPSLQLSGAASLNNLKLEEAKDTPTVRLKSLNVSLESIEPLVKRFTVDRIAADQLELYVRRDRHGRINLANLVEPDEKDEKEPLPYFLIRSMSLNSAVVHVRDEQRVKPFETILKDIRLTVRNLTSEKEKPGRLDLNLAGPEQSSLKATADIVLEPLSVSRLNVQIADLRIPQSGSNTDMVRIGLFGIAGGAFELDRRSVSADEISIAKSRVNIQRNSKGAVNLSEIAGGRDTKTDAKAAKAAEGEKAAKASPWQYGVKKVALNDIGVHWEDQMPSAGTAEIGIEKIQGRIDNISSVPNSAANLFLKARVSPRGNVDVTGPVIMAPRMSVRLQVKADGLPILPAQPYFADRVNIRVTSGAVGVRGNLSVQQAEQTQIQYQGDIQVNRFASVDKVNSNDFLNWETLHFSGVKVSTEPVNVAIREVSLSNFYSRLIINPDGSINVQHVTGSNEESRQAVAGKGGAAPPTTASQEPVDDKPETPSERTAVPNSEDKKLKKSGAQTAPVPIKINRVTLKGGRVNFSDRFIKPNYNANLVQIGGRISGLSSNLATTADVEIRGKVDNSAPVEILGKINPLSGNLFLDLAASAKGVDLPTATPYSARYAGYPIIKGKLSMDVKYYIENRGLRAENRVMLDQLTFGEKVESPRATKLPVLLAVALLKDRNGVIDVNLPISGSLDDPQFSVGGIILKVIINLITKAVTAPFALLGSLFGGGEELSFIEFEPGRADLDKTAREKIASLSRALENRPALKLDITGRVDPSPDTEGLRRRIMERKVKAVKFQRLVKQGNAPSSLDEVRIDPSEYHRLLKQVYSQEKFPKPRNAIGLAKDLPVPEMENLLLSHITVTDDDLRQLGIRRARVVSDAIVKAGDVAAERVFILEPKLKIEAGEKGPAEKARASRVDFSLK